MKKLIVFILAAFSSPSARAADVDILYLGVRGGVAVYSNLPANSAFGMGLDLGFRYATGFGIGITGNYNVPGAASISTLFFGVGPTYSVTKDRAQLTFGLDMGVLSLTNDLASGSRFALSPKVSAEFEVSQNVFATLGLQYIAGFGSSPHPGIFFPSVGLGYRF